MKARFHSFDDTRKTSKGPKVSAEDAARAIEHIVENALIQVQRKVMALADTEANTILRPLAEKLSENAAALFGNLFSDEESGNLLLPLGTRYVTRQANVISVLIEQAPCTRSLKIWDAAIKGHGADKGTGKHVVRSYSLPYVLFGFQFVKQSGGFMCNSRRVAFNTTALRNLTEDVYKPWLPNVHTEGGQSCEICVGSVMDTSQTFKSISQYIEWFLAKYWQSEFTSDLSNHIAAMHKHSEFSYKEWANLTTTNPSFVLNERHSWYSRACTAAGLCRISEETKKNAYLEFKKSIKRLVDAEIEKLIDRLGESLGDVDVGLLHPSSHQVESIRQYGEAYAQAAADDISEYYSQRVQDQFDELERKTRDLMARALGSSNSSDFGLDSPW